MLALRTEVRYLLFPGGKTSEMKSTAIVAVAASTGLKWKIR